MTENQLSSYAELILYGVGGVSGRKVYIVFEEPGKPLARTLADLCYRRGALLVDYQFKDPYFHKSLIDHGSDGALETLSDWMASKLDHLSSGDWLYINISGSEESHLVKGLDSDRETRAALFRAKQTTLFNQRVAGFQFPWITVLVPSREKAMEVFPDLSEEQAFARYRQAVIDVLHLDGDARGYWEKEFTSIIKRRDRFSAMDLRSLHFEDPEAGTYLTMDLIPGSRWAAAEETLPTGETVRVNIPSCEVFCSPDCRSVSGRVQITKDFIPTRFPGTVVKGAWFEFEKGRAVRFGAEEGEAVLGKLLDMDERARYLGEVALVDRKSPVALQDMLFHNTLFDENASSHIAFGLGFPALTGGMENASSQERLARGINESLIHQDMMIGTRNMCVTALDGGGKTRVLMEKGTFV